MREGLIRDHCQRGVITGIEGAYEREVDQALVVVASDNYVLMKRHHFYVLNLQKCDDSAIHINFGVHWSLVLTCAYLRHLHLIKGSFLLSEWRLMKVCDAPQQLRILAWANTHHIEIAHSPVFLGEHYVVVFV